MRWLLLLAGALLLILKIWPRALWAVLCLATLLTAAVLYEEKREQDLLNQIVMAVEYLPAQCAQGRPLRVTCTNETASELEKLIFSIHARIPGYSSVITPYTYRQYESEKIIAPGDSYSDCYPLPLLSRTPAADIPLENLEWSAAPDRAWFSK